MIKKYSIYIKQENPITFADLTSGEVVQKQYEFLQRCIKIPPSSDVTAGGFGYFWTIYCTENEFTMMVLQSPYMIDFVEGHDDFSI